MDWVTIGLCIGAFYLGLFVGVIIQRWLRYKASYSGTMFVIKGEEKTVYSLELDEDPIAFQDRAEVIFKVKTSDENPDSDENIAYNRTN